MERRLGNVFRVLLSPRMVGLHLLALVATTAAVWLGLWQYDAWQTGRESQAVDRANATPETLDAVMSPDDPYPADAIGQPVEFRGRWLVDETFFVSGREDQDRTGYWVVTPVAVCEAGCAPDNPAMLVVRGWSPAAEDPGSSPAGTVELAGWLQPPEGSGTQDPDPSDDVLPEVRIADAIQRVDQDLYGAYVIAEVAPTRPTDGTSTLETVSPASLPEPSTFTGLRNLLYAFEWWVFGVFAVFIWWRWCTDEVRAVRSDTGSADTSSQGLESTEVASRP